MRNELASETYELKSTWTRLIHRIHTLGVTQQTYLNKVAGLAEKRVYPRQVPSHLEDSSSSLDGSHLWRMNNWQKGWVVLDQENKKASFLFSSKSGELFHKIDMIEVAHWDCLECLLMVFIKKKVCGPDRIATPAFRINKRAVFQSCGSVMDVLGKAIEDRTPVNWTIPVGGGVVMRKQKSMRMLPEKMEQ